MQEWCLRSISRCKVNITDCGNLVSFRRSPFVLLTGSSCLRDETWNGQYSRQETKQAHESADNVTPPPPLWPRRFWDDKSPTSRWVAWPHPCWRRSTSDRPSTSGDNTDVISYWPTIDNWLLCCVSVCVCAWATKRQGGKDLCVIDPPSMQDNPWWHSNQQTWLISMFGFF